MGLLRVPWTEWLHFQFSLSCIGEGNGNPLQCSCLENPRDGRAWWAAVYGVAESQTRLKWCSSSSSSFARSRKLLEACVEWGGSLALGVSLRLEVTLLAACLRGQRPESESLSWLCLLSTWIEALLVTMRFLRTQIGNCRICSDWKYSGLLPLAALALSGPEEALRWVLSQLLRYSFVESVGMNWKDWP